MIAPVLLPYIERRDVGAFPLHCRLEDWLGLDGLFYLKADAKRGVVELQLPVPTGAAVAGKDVDHVN